MTLVNRLKLYFYKKKVKKYTEDLFYHMTSVCDYLHSNNTTVQVGDLIKEAICLIGTWDRVSENLFKHKALGVSIEIKKNASLQQTTQQLLELEIKNMTMPLNNELSEQLQKESQEILEKNFSERPVDYSC